MPKFINFLFILIVTAFISSCSQDYSDDINASGNVLGDTLIVALTTGTSSCYIQDGDTLGLDYELLEQFSEANEQPVKYIMVSSLSQGIELLKEKKIHLFASTTFLSKSLRDFKFYFLPNDAAMVLVQNTGLKSVNNLLELKGKTIVVPQNSTYHMRLQTLNEEIGGGINIETVPDTVSSEELIVKLGKREINFTIAHRNQFNLYKRHFNGLDARLNITFKQKNGWFSLENPKLDSLIQKWYNTEDFAETLQFLQLKYSRINPFTESAKLLTPKGAISPFDAHFKKYSKEINWDWRLIAAIAYHETGFDPTKVSRVGASGLMQLMPGTAQSFGLDAYTVFDAEKNIEAGIQYIKSLNLLFRNVLSPEDKIKFVMASYNSGPAHVIDAMNLAEKYGKNKYKWHDNVEFYFQKLNLPEYYQDEVVKSSKYNSTQTIRYLREVQETHLKYIEQTAKLNK